MCGIVGFLGNFSKGLLQEMNDTQIHRGRDGEGMWLSAPTENNSSKKNQIGLAHRRLSIIDLSDNAKQPMSACKERYQVTFNGEIYNFKALAKELAEKGYEFNHSSDTAILAPLYDAYGTEMLDKLNGIFAFAIWDNQAETLFIARDHMGTKPLYYSQSDDGLLFASELKSLLNYKNLSKEINHNAIFSYLTYLWSPGEDTMLSSVKKLLPGHYMLAKLGQKTEFKKWYKTPLPEIKDGKPQYDESKTPQDLLHLFDEVVSDQLVSDAPVGIFLSGGLDSGAIAASICARDSRPLDAFCVDFVDGSPSMENEGFSKDIDYARKIAKQYDINLHRVEVGEDSLNQLQDMVYYLDEPQADPAPLYVREISKIAREMDIKVLLGGTGGDDIFTGYRRHHAINMMNKIDFLPQGLKRNCGKVIEKIPFGDNLKRRLSKLCYMLETDLKDSLLRSYHYTTDTMLLEILTPKMRQKFMTRHADHLECVLEENSEQHPINKQLFMEWNGFLPDHNLNYTDKMGMVEGVEIRVPFLDKRMLDFAADLPINMKIRNGEAKYILKKAMENRLPHDVIYRPKAGFGAPVRTWMQTTAKEFVREILSSKSFVHREIFDITGINKVFNDTITGERDGAYSILSAIVIELWLRRFIDSNNLKT